MESYDQDGDSEMKLTAWFPENICPVKEGVYEVDDDFLFPSDTWYAYWNGERFGYRTCQGIDEAYRTKNFPTELPNLARWRGLAEKP